MSHRALSWMLKLLDVCSVAACLVVAAGVMPAAEAAGELPQGSVVLFACGVAPLMVVAAAAWALFSAIGRGETFVVANARRLRVMGVAAAASAVVWVVGLAPVALGAVVASFSVVASLSVALVFCVALATVAAALSLLTDSAADLKSDNDLVV